MFTNKMCFITLLMTFLLLSMVEALVRYEEHSQNIDILNSFASQPQLRKLKVGGG